MVGFAAWRNAHTCLPHYYHHTVDTHHTPASDHAVVTSYDGLPSATKQSPDRRMPIGGNWRGGRDSNSRGNCFPSGLANRRTRPTMRPPHAWYEREWRRERDSNPRNVSSLVFKTSAIDHSAISPEMVMCMAGGTGIEPATCGFGGRCSA